MATSQRIFSLDLIRAVAIIGVLTIHLTYPIYARPDFIGGSTWWLAQTLDSFFRVSIPLFIMLSGYLLIPKKESIAQTFKRLLQRLLLPLVVWSLFYFYWEGYWFGTAHSYTELISGFLSGGVFHLYFLFIMMELYVLLPVIRTIMQEAHEQVKKYFTTVALAFGLLFTALAYFKFKDSYLINFVTVGLPYLGYFLAGYLLGQKKFSNNVVMFLGFGWLASIITSAVLAYWNLGQFTQNNFTFWNSISYFDDYVSINVMVSSLLSFVVLINLRLNWLQNTFLKPVIESISKSAMGMYLAHPFVMNIIDRRFGFQVDFMTESLLEYLIKRTVIVVSVCFCLSYVITSIPILRKVVGEK